MCLDFVNSVHSRIQDKSNNAFEYAIIRDKLQNYRDLAEWSKDAGILTEKDTKYLIKLAANKEKEAKVIFFRAIELRESLFRIFKFLIEGWKPKDTDIELLNREYDSAREN